MASKHCALPDSQSGKLDDRSRLSCLGTWSCSSGVSCSTCVATGRRPGGISSMVQMAMSPFSTSARVRGMGVAVIASTCGGGLLLAWSRALCSTPNLGV